MAAKTILALASVFVAVPVVAAEKTVDLGLFLAEVRSFNGTSLELSVLVFESYQNRRSLDANYDLIEFGVKSKIKKETVQVQNDLRVSSQPVRDKSGNGTFRRIGKPTPALSSDIRSKEIVTVRVKKGVKTGQLYTDRVIVHPVTP